MLKRPVSEVTFAFLDTETTGLSPAAGARVCEVAVLAVRGGVEVGSLQSLVNPGCRIAPEAQRIHGISDAMVAGSPSFKELSPRLDAILEGSAMVCHNAPFDVGFLQAEYRLAGGSLPPVPVVDTLSIARRHFRFPRNSLGKIAETLGVSAEGWHRAGGDVRMLRAVFDHFLSALSRKGVRTLEDILKL